MEVFGDCKTDEDVKRMHQEITELIAEKGVEFISDLIEKKSDKWKDEIIQIGIFGESGSGKSTFVNTLRGLKRGDEGFADQGYIGNTTKTATKYTVKDNPNIIFTDGVGCGTIQYKRGSEYLKSLEIEKFDFVLLMSNRNFSQDDAWFAKEIRNMGKPLFFVRTKFDEILRSAKADGIPGENIHKQILTTCAENIKDSGIPSTSIFIISNYDTSLGDIDPLMVAILKTLSLKKREALLHSIQPLSHQVIREKKEELIQRVNLISLLSVVSPVLYLPGFENDFDLSVLDSEIQFYLKEFSLTEDKIERTCIRLKIDYDELLCKLPRVRNLLKIQGIKGAIKESLQIEFDEETTKFIAMQVLKILPVIGTVISSSYWYIACLKMLKNEIDLLEKDAHKLLDEALEKLKI
ncbi:unnamed protein product [Mytilus coruscus]|uniref:IRG-type G domain-containing protein n=1 Tax=Mytilus coruscus TaxID=42192 RepID=A0A6J8AMY9_MYTCO|nr:unnamed protein product [Mytilus coruscus]